VYRTIAAIALGLALLAGAHPAFAGAKEDMLAADRAFSDLSASKGPHAAFLAYMTDDVLLYDGDHPPIVGKAAVAAYYAQVDRTHPNRKSDHLAWTPVSADASPDGALGYTRGLWTLAATKKDGSPVNLKGYYVTEWRKQADGKYKFCLDIGGTY
jgi:ketosteroid isomerase-like protein